MGSHYLCTDEIDPNVPVLSVISSAIGSLTDSNKLVNTAGSAIGEALSHNTIKNYLNKLIHSRKK